MTIFYYDEVLKACCNHEFIDMISISKIAPSLEFQYFITTEFEWQSAYLKSL